jgi:hypothetical protein
LLFALLGENIARAKPTLPIAHPTTTTSLMRNIKGILIKARIGFKAFISLGIAIKNSNFRAAFPSSVVQRKMAQYNAASRYSAAPQQPNKLLKSSIMNHSNSTHNQVLSLSQYSNSLQSHGEYGNSQRTSSSLTFRNSSTLRKRKVNVNVDEELDEINQTKQEGAYNSEAAKKREQAELDFIMTFELTETQQLVFDAVVNRKQSVFYTGVAGTGE